MNAAEADAFLTAMADRIDEEFDGNGRLRPLYGLRIQRLTHDELKLFCAVALGMDLA